MTSASMKFIYFDLGNVLLTFDHQRACNQVGHLVSLPASRIRALLFESGLQERYEQGELASGEFYEEFCRLSQTRPDQDAFHLASSQIFALNVPIVPIVGHLKAAGYPLGILSNTCESHWQHVSDGRFCVIARFFPTLALSYQLRTSKPDLEIYRRAAQLAGVAPGSIFFVDDRAENVEGACRAGLEAVLYRGPQALAADLRGRGVSFNY